MPMPPKCVQDWPKLGSGTKAKTFKQFEVIICT